MISLTVAVLYLLAAGGIIKILDVEISAFPLATMIAWHIYYVGEFLAEVYDAVLMNCPEQYVALLAASVVSIALMFRRGGFTRRVL